MKIYILPASPLKTTLEKQECSQSTALPNTTINMTITIYFSKHSETASLTEEIIMPKNTFWGSRLTTTKERELHKVMQNNHLRHLSTRQPTYWPSDPNKIRDLVDFCVTKGNDTKKFTVESCLDLTPDHTPILINIDGKEESQLEATITVY